MNYVPYKGWNEELLVAPSCIHWLHRDDEGGHCYVQGLDHVNALKPSTQGQHPVGAKVQGYGGGSYLVLPSGDVIFVHAQDGLVYRQSAEEEQAPPVQLTAPGPWRYGDLCYDPRREMLLCVREGSGEPAHAQATQIVALHCNAEGLPPCVVAQGEDFYAAPRLSPCGTRLAWVSWQFPHMPWDESQLQIANIPAEGYGAVEVIRRIRSTGVSIIEPQWASDGYLYYLDDAVGWWSPCRLSGMEAAPQRIVDARFEFGFPPYMMGGSTYALAQASHDHPDVMVAAAWHDGALQLLKVNPATGEWQVLPHAFEEIRGLQYAQGAFWFIGVSTDQPARIVRMSRDTLDCSIVRAVMNPPPWQARPPLDLRVRARHGGLIHARMWCPRQRMPKAGHPLIVNVHGGPTGMASAAFHPVAQFWLDSGYAFVEVNHRGSTGFGRAHREALRTQWGLAEVEDCLDIIEAIMQAWPIDAQRLYVRGNSAGGYTALRALSRSNLFKAAACYWGVTDLARLWSRTHKFESRYTHSLIGAYPSAAYRERSPIHDVKEIKAPVIFFQGEQDRIVDAEQTRAMAQALSHHQPSTQCHLYAQEGHGFAQPANLADALERERAFYQAH